MRLQKDSGTKISTRPKKFFRVPIDVITTTMEYHPLATFEYWHDLPSDIQQDILLQLSIKDLLNFTSSNKLMLEKVNKNNLLWRTFYNQRAGANDLKTSSNTSDWKAQYQDMFSNVSSGIY